MPQSVGIPRYRTSGYNTIGSSHKASNDPTIRENENPSSLYIGEGNRDPSQPRASTSQESLSKSNIISSVRSNMLTIKLL